jgi:hypothetical protein
MVTKAAELARQAAEIADPFDRARMEAEAIRETRRATALAKLPAVIAFLRGLMEADEPTLCFVHHHAVTDGIVEALEGAKPVCITGRQDKTQKDDAVTAFARGDTNLCLISLRAATGIDGLQKRARVVVFAELDWSPAVHRQAEDRAHRMGQRDSVLVYYLVTDLGTDPFVMMTLNLAIARHNPMATRASYGCPVGCWFCIVPKMDGKAFTLLPDFVPRPVLCDDNLSALPADYQQHIVDRYLRPACAAGCEFGLRARTFDDEVYARWSPILKGPWRFGYDEKTEGENVARVFRMLKDVSPRRKQVYTMIGHEPFEVCMDRIRRVIAAGAEPYAQPFIKLNALVKQPDRGREDAGL